MSYESAPCWIREIPEHLKTSEISNEAVAVLLLSTFSSVLFLNPDRFKKQDMCIKALEVDPWNLYNISDNLKTQKMCDKAIKDDPSSLQFVPDWFVTQEQIDIWYDDNYWYHNDELIEWYEGYKKRKAQKAKIKEELLPFALAPRLYHGLVYVRRRKEMVEVTDSCF